MLRNFMFLTVGLILGCLLFEQGLDDKCTIKGGTMEGGLCHVTYIANGAYNKVRD